MTDITTSQGGALLPIQQAYPGLSADVAATLQASFGEDLSRAAFTGLSLKGWQFSVAGQPLPEQALNCIVIADAPADHCLWYANPYNGEAAVQPDALWIKGQEPANLPADILTPDAGGRHKYQIRRRAVILRVRPDGATDPTPIGWDINAVSLYGKDAGNDAMSYSGFRRWCARFQILPCAVMVTVVFDRTQSVPTVRFKPATRPDGTPLLFGMDQIVWIAQQVARPEVKDLLRVTSIPFLGAPSVQAAPAASPYGAVPATPAPVAAPVSAPPAPTAPAAPAPSQPQARAPAPAPGSAPVMSVPAPAPAPTATPATAPAPVTAPAQPAVVPQVVSSAATPSTGNSRLDSLLAKAQGYTGKGA